MSELAPLRPILADILDGLAVTRFQINTIAGDEAGLRLWRGAETLRWAHDFDEEPSYGERDELERLRSFVSGVEDILGDKSKHPGRQLKAVAELLS